MFWEREKKKRKGKGQVSVLTCYNTDRIELENAVSLSAINQEVSEK